MNRRVLLKTYKQLKPRSPLRFKLSSSSQHIGYSTIGAKYIWRSGRMPDSVTAWQKRHRIPCYHRRTEDNKRRCHWILISLPGRNIVSETWNSHWKMGFNKPVNSSQSLVIEALSRNDSFVSFYIFSWRFMILHGIIRRKFLICGRNSAVEC